MIVAAVAMPGASASTGTVQAVQYTNFSAASVREEQINVNRPLAISITGSLSQGDLVTLTVAGTMVRSGGGGDGSRQTPLRISSQNGPNFSVVGSNTGSDGSQTLILTTNRALPDGTYNKTISWVPLEGASVEATQDEILTWPLGTYTADISVSVQGVNGAPQAYTLNRTPVGGGSED